MRSSILFSRKSVFFIMMLILTLVIPQTSCMSLNSPDESVYKVSTMSSSYDDFIEKPRFWYAIKTNFENPTDLIIEENHYFTSKNESVNTRASFLCIMVYNPEKGYSYTLQSPNAYPSINDYYFQFRFGLIDWGYYNIDYDGDFMTDSGFSRSTYFDLIGTNYIIFAAYTAECWFDFHIETSEETTFSVTDGDDSFFYTREDFSGNINIGWNKGTITFNGKKVINVENRLFAWFKQRGTTGINFLRYIGPNRRGEWQFVKSQDFEILYEMNSNYPFLFAHDLINGRSGKWKFKVNMINIDEYCLYPNVLLFGADIKLPT